MNINKNYYKILSPEKLQKYLLTYAKIDTIMCPDDEWLKIYYYDKNWMPNGHFFTIDDSGGDHYHILFSEKGCIIKGFDHECELSPYNFDKENFPEIIKNHDFYENAPTFLHELLNDPALEKDITTFCVWQTKNENNWCFSPFNIPDNWNDGIQSFLTYLPNLTDYKIWFEEDYYEMDLDFDILEQIYHGETITIDMIKKLNPKGNADVIFENLNELF